MLHVCQFFRKPRAGLHSIEELYKTVRAHLPTDISCTIWCCEHPSQGIMPRLLNVWNAQRHTTTVNHVTGDVHYLTYNLPKRRTILTIHDCVCLTRAKGLKKWLLWFFWYYIPSKRCQYIVTISETAKKEICSYISFDQRRMRVIYNPLHAEFKPSPKPFDSDKPNILIVGATPNKNLDRIAQALEGLNCRLTIIGKLSRDQVDLLSRYGITYDSMYDLTRDQVIDCYRAADLLLFASVYEGFGLPIIEAQAIGRPVITSNISSMPEIAGDAADFVDPYDTASIRAGVQRVLSDQNYRNQLVLDGFKNVERFNPSACAEAYASLYRELDETRSC